MWRARHRAGFVTHDDQRTASLLFLAAILPMRDAAIDRAAQPVGVERFIAGQERRPLVTRHVFGLERMRLVAHQFGASAR